jgi:hypothetical protein
MGCEVDGSSRADNDVGPLLSSFYDGDFGRGAFANRTFSPSAMVGWVKMASRNAV